MKDFAQFGMAQPTSVVFTAQAVTRSTMKFFGVVLGLSSLGLWLVPGATLDGVEMLVRLVLSFLFLGIAIGMWGIGRPTLCEEFEFDTVNLRLNHVLRGEDGIARLRRQYRFDELESLRLERGVLRARLHGGHEVLRLAVGARLDRKAQKLLAGLGN